jgi:hypothetical protein
VILSADPAQLHLYDPAANAEVFRVDLPLAGAAVSVGPDGLEAAVGHDSYVSLVDLKQGMVAMTVPTAANAADIVLAGNGYAYVIPTTGQSVKVHSIDLAAGIDHYDSSGFVNGGSKAKLHLSGTSMYVAGSQASPDLSRFDLTGGIAVQVEPQMNPVYHADSGLWLSEDGRRVFTRGGNIFRSAPNAADDGTFEMALWLRWADACPIQDLVHSSAAGKVYAILQVDPTFTGLEHVDEIVYEYDYDHLMGGIDDLAIPCSPGRSESTTSHGRFVFTSNDGLAVYVITKADSSAALLHDNGIVRIQ